MSPVGYETILYDLSEGVATITLNRPDRMNAWSGLLQAEVSDAMAEADEDDAVRAVILTGAGRAFCAGADLSGGDFGGPELPSLRSLWPYEVRKPVIAAINGHAIGIGITYPMTCDVRFVAEDAKIAFAFVRRGALPERRSHSILPRVVGFSTAAELLLSGRTFLGAEAAELGVATKALPAEQVLPAARALAQDIAANTAPISVAVTKALLWRGLDASLEDNGRLEGDLFQKVIGLPDAAEGIAAFVEKRAPMWTGRVSTDIPT